MEIITDKVKLRVRCELVPEITEDVIVVADELSRIRNERQAAGVAAPQIGQYIRLIVLKVKGKEITLVNPRIASKRGIQMSEEKCLSIPNQKYLIQRPQSLKLKGTTLDGTKVTLKLSGYDACVACHEVDHLNGILIDTGTYIGEETEEPTTKLAYG